MNRPASIFLMVVFPFMAEAQVSRFEVPPSSEGLRWFKGNTHTHTLESDGDSPPEEVIRWYRSHGYHFLVISDHNVLVDPARYSSFVDTSFLLISGEEITTSAERKPVHVNGLNIPRLIQPRGDSTILKTLQLNIDAVREVDGVPHINHPNYQWAFDHQILAHVRNDKLLEIFNGHPHVHNLGGGGSPGMEEIWDHLLTGGKRIYGIAVDDAHHFRGEFSPDRSNPGRGWVVVRGRHLNAREILGKMEQGMFYASTGVSLDDIAVTPTTLKIKIRPRQDFRFETEFIGDGKILAKTGENPAVYELTSRVSYVRARVRDSAGAVAWIQPVFTVHEE